MNFTLETHNNYQLFSIHEERLDAHNSSALKDAILHVIEQGETQIVVQLDKVRFIDSSGLGALLSGYKNAAAKSGKLILVSVQPQVLSMFELTRLNHIFEIYTDLTEIA